MTRTPTDLLHELLRQAPAQELTNSLLEPHAIIDEACGWLSDPRPYNKLHHRQAWTSCFADLDAALSAFGPELAALTESNRADATAALQPLRNQKRPPTDDRRRAARDALQRLRLALHEQDALAAMWHDIVNAIADNQDDLAMRYRAQCLHAALRHSSRSPDSTLSLVEGVLTDRALWEHEARVLLGDLQREADGLPVASPTDTGGLAEAERLALCERLLVAPPAPRHHVVWIAFDHAAVRAHPCVTVGAVQFYEADLIRSAVAAGESAAPLPSELFHPWLTDVDIPEGDVVLARVDLGTRIVADAPAEARRLARTLVNAAAFAVPIEDGLTWKPLDDFLYFIDDRFAASSRNARDPIPPGDLLKESVAEELESLAASALPDPEWHTANLDVLEGLRRFRETDSLDPAAQLVMGVLVLDRVAVRVDPEDPGWWQYLDDYWKTAWVRHHLFNRVLHVLRNSPHIWPSMLLDIEPDARAQVETLLAGVVQRLGDFRITVDVASGVSVLPQLAACFSGYSLWGVRLRTAVRGTATADAVRASVTLLEQDWDLMRQRAQRCRNALAHAGPVNVQVVTSAARFIHQLVGFALSQERTAILERIDVDGAHVALASDARRWREHIESALEPASAFAEPAASATV